MKIEGECTIRVDSWGRILFINLPMNPPLTSEQAQKIYDRKAKVSVMVIE
jgi:hypothetical protein